MQPRETETTYDSSPNGAKEHSPGCSPGKPKRHTLQSQYGINTYWWTLAESVDTVREGIKPGMKFQVIPDWKNAIVELVTAVEKDIAAGTAE
ncbi:MAG: hypothetical protein IKO93_02745 [Lentisphaeria bacterium]|nr:hypothetical protein [Lentisphaeria bacterium]